MVLFKRKPVQLLPPKDVKDDNAEVREVTFTNDATSTDAGPQVWHIPQTGEVFAHYEEYLNRMDFYKQRRFICQITGHSGLTFFEALKSELAGAEEVEQAFPEALKGPVLRRVQFQTVSRIDALVDMVFEEFRADYYPGEAVTVSTADGERLQGVVREKTRFGGKVLPDGTQTAPYTRYTVSLEDRPGIEAVVDDDHIFRDRKIFTKSVLRSFIKKTVTREAWNGAPWLVKHDVASQYHIDSRIPPHLRYDTKLMERKQLQAQKRASHTPTQDAQGTNGVNGAMQNGPARLPELKPAPKNQKGKHQSPEFPQGQNGSPGILGGPEAGIFHAPPHKNPFQLPLNFRNQPLPHSMTAPELPPPPPPPKYPIEDLQVPLREGVVRPPLAFLCNDPPIASDVAVNGSASLRDKLSMKSVGSFLETWDTLNVYCEIFKLDSFTFDDFVEAMCVASEDTTVQMFEEIHCAVLKQIVSAEADGGKVNVQLPELDDEEEDSEEEEEEETKEPTPETDRPPARATRSSLAKAEAERLLAEARAAEKESQNVEPEIKHRAEDLLEDYDWIEELRKRNFSNGGWERIMVGLLHQLSKNERLEERCEDLLAQLCPPDVDPTQDTVRERYANLDVNYRVQALQIVCMLTTQTKAMRTYMEECSEQMTAFRKEKIDWQRQRKQAIEELRALNDQRKILLPENMPPSPPPEQKADEDVKMTDADESVADAEDEVLDSDEEGAPRRNFRRANDRAAERQRKRKEEKERKEKAAEAAKVPKQSKQFLKVLKDIQKKEDLVKKCEEEIAVIDNDLREADCGRTRVLGKDRFWNRYYWFERNGMPYGGLPDSSTAEAEYANGCIWVQGPDELERVGYIDTDPEYQAEYKSKFDMTVPERKKLEEGATSVFNAHQWGYYSEPEQVDELLKWLDPRGFNELRLRKEIVAFRDKIVQHMENRKKYLAAAEPEEPEKEEKKEKRRDSKRMSTRGRHHEPTPEPANYRCLAWENTTAMEELGHLHSEPPPPPRPKKQTAKKRQAVEPSPEPAPAPKTRRRK
ncbi:chromatin assembly protein [Colletotrichum incanum]|nr:chromatin assembly protein [Colletotrichum incanum]